VGGKLPNLHSQVRVLRLASHPEKPQRVPFLTCALLEVKRNVKKGKNRIKVLVALPKET